MAWIISENYRESVETNLTDRLTANLYNIMGSVSPNINGNLVGRPDLRDSRFQAFQSGYYWSVIEVSNPSNQISSSSLVGEQIDIPLSTVFDESFQRKSRIADKVGNQLVAIEAQAFLGDGENLYSFKITGNRSEVDRQVNQFVRQLLLVLGLFALGFVLVTYFIVRIGLSPLREATQKLGDIREGKIEKLDGEYPLEIQPLIDETNSLISSNQSVIERARTQVGNLAHSLKTPLAVLKNEGAKTRPELRDIIEQQISQMQSQIQTYLDRARISARAGTITSRTNIVPAIERLLRVMTKLNPNLSFVFSQASEATLLFAGEQQDFEEMLGNLLENASKFAKSTVKISTNNVQANMITLEIEDDGVGMSADQAKAALQRGTRIDETKPGSGLGLSIVKDIAGEYGGSIALSTSPLGGLKASLTIPTQGKT
ncbi:MAG: sensor histidine kinase [Salaquimonas sp.]